MADPISFYRNFINSINQNLNDLQVLDTFQDRLAKDPTLAADAAAAANASGRSDLTAEDFNNAAAAINQVLFALNSGTPTQISYLYKML